MQLLTFLVATASLASAADIWRTTGTNCAGSRIGFIPLTKHSRFQVWGGTNCNSGSSGIFKDPAKVTEKCIRFSWSDILVSAKWLAGSGTKRDVEEPCAEPNSAVYTRGGVEHKIDIPNGKTIEVEQWVEHEEWDKLAALEVEDAE
ncbi:hypothetical protein K469DRAFT_697914 [Zopfia rhizophila CBS 207.26]|uniref:Uncharacterized protein n=1 Tax=Zopfia rhizophila CBS 207.26 TaxID=1314779 RepID=A0A6A6EJ33_9PEZI|nr:hypothetical protein K469DRAFT_697914 [Zopfia rhizophila CBS 207.26]